MATWKNININTDLIQHETAKAVLIKMPKSSGLSNFSFWHPTKLVREGRHSAAVSIGYTDEFEFRLKRYGKGTYNSSKVLEEKTLTADEFEEYFKEIDSNIQGKKSPDAKSYYRENKPAEVEPEQAEVLNELLN